MIQTIWKGSIIAWLVVHLFVRDAEILHAPHDLPVQLVHKSPSLVHLPLWYSLMPSLSSSGGDQADLQLQESSNFLPWTNPGQFPGWSLIPSFHEIPDRTFPAPLYRISSTFPCTLRLGKCLPNHILLLSARFYGGRVLWWVWWIFDN